ncbi:MAG: vanadium-dependent haloperoxidase [Bacteroidota bacterium]
MRIRNIVAIAIICSILVSCKEKTDYIKVTSDPMMFCRTVYELNNVVMGNNFSPIVASRNYLYASVAAYEIMAGGYPRQYTSLAGQLHGLGALPQPDSTKKIDYEFAALLAFCKLGESVTFPAGSMQVYTDSLKTLVTEKGMPDEVMKNSMAYADTVSAVILAWSQKDNYTQTRSASKYNVIDTPGRWVPTPPAYSPAMEPHWNEIRPLVLDSANQFMPPPQYKFDMTNKNSDYYKEVMYIKKAIDSITPEQRHMAEFWDDNPFKLNVSGHVMFGTKKFSPPGHWMSITGIAAQKAKADYGTTVYAFAIAAIAQFDAFIQCWDQKYRSNTVRPETVINKYIDPNWQPILQTPPFPEYTCGHSTGSAAAAEVLTHVFGDRFAYTDTTELEFGIASRSYHSFRDAAEENNWARFYGGIHFHHSCIVSTIYGKKVGDLVVEKLKMKN